MKPFNEGKKDFKVGQLVNPYNPDTTRYREWERGFNSAYFVNLEVLKRKEQNDYQKNERET